MIRRIRINTSKRHEAIDLTDEVKEIVKDSKVMQGLCNIYSRHTTSAIIINENDDPKVQEDILNFLAGLVERGIWEHDTSGRCDRENGDSHIQSSLLSHCGTVPIEDGRLLLGRWQNIFFFELDGPRQDRDIVVTIMKDE